MCLLGGTPPLPSISETDHHHHCRVVVSDGRRVADEISDGNGETGKRESEDRDERERETTEDSGAAAHDSDEGFSDGSGTVLVRRVILTSNGDQWMVVSCGDVGWPTTAVGGAGDTGRNRGGG
ncbi:hypothetical protein Hdeb2414_s0010g00349411 [Helianthus debilis subsp. tardiflorus]